MLCFNGQNLLNAESYGGTKCLLNVSLARGILLAHSRESIRGIILGSSYFLILAGKDELFNTLHVHALTPIPSKKVQYRDSWSPLIHMKEIKDFHGLSF